MSIIIDIICGTTFWRFSKHDSILTRVSAAYDPYNCSRKVIPIMRSRISRYAYLGLSIKGYAA
jgi:hypothetical protein